MTTGFAHRLRFTGRFTGLWIGIMAGITTGMLADRVEAAVEWQDSTLANGLRLITVRDNRAPMAIVQLWYRVGAADEPDGKTGMSHLLEHMMFKGTPDIPAGEFSRRLSRQGGSSNAATSRDYTVYYAKVGQAHVLDTLKMEIDRMRNLRLNPQDATDRTAFTAEHAVVVEERRQRTDTDPPARFFEKFGRIAHPVHPYGRPVIGWADDLQRLTIDDLATWYRRFYAPEHAILVIVGDIVPAEMPDRIAALFPPLPAQDPAPSVPEAREARPGRLDSWPQDPPPAAVQRLDHVDTDARLPVLHMAFHAPTLTTRPGDADSARAPFAIDLLETLLGAGMSSRLYKHLVVETGLAISVDVDYDGTARDPSLFTITAVPKDGSPAGMTRLEHEIVAQLHAIRDQLVPEPELRKARNSGIARHVYARDSLSTLAWTIGRLAVNGNNWPDIVFRYPELLESVTAEEVRHAARQWLDPSRATIGRLFTTRGE